MAVWGNNTSDNNNINVSAGSIACVGAASLTNQQLDDVNFNSGTYTANKTYRVAVYGNSVEDVNGATLIEDLGTVTVSAAFTTYTVTSSTNPTEISDYAYLIIALKTSDNNSTTIRGDTSAAVADIVEYSTYTTYNDHTVAWAATYADPDTDIDPGSLRAWINHSDAPAAAGGMQLVGGRGLVG